MFSRHWVDKEYYNSLDDKYKTSDDVFFIKDANEIAQENMGSINEIERLLSETSELSTELKNSI